MSRWARFRMWLRSGPKFTSPAVLLPYLILAIVVVGSIHSNSNRVDDFRSLSEHQAVDSLMRDTVQCQISQDNRDGIVLLALGVRDAFRKLGIPDSPQLQAYEAQFDVLIAQFPPVRC